MKSERTGVNGILFPQEETPSNWMSARNGMLVDAGLVMHLIRHATRPYNIAPHEWKACLNAVVESVEMAPAEWWKEP